MTLTDKQLAFVEAYIGEAKGSATEAARIAGYGGEDASEAYLSRVGSENVRKCKIRSAIDDRRDELRENQHQHLSPEDIHQIWAEIATDPEISASSRLKATKLAAKAQALFVERVRHEGITELEISLPERGSDE